jgi:hypothetical protein
MIRITMRTPSQEVDMRRVLVRSLLLGSMAATLVSGVALGHECFIASRSDAGDLAAGSHSKVWLTVATLEDVFGFVEEEGGVALSESQMAWAVNAAREAGLPNQFTIFVGNHTINEGTPAAERHAGDGKGVDHVTNWVPVLIGIYLEALEQ